MTFTGKKDMKYNYFCYHQLVFAYSVDSVWAKSLYLVFTYDFFFFAEASLQDLQTHEDKKKSM